jgi:hypothetical protein
MAENAHQWAGAITLSSGVLGTIVGTSGVFSVFSDIAAPRWVQIVQAMLGLIVGLIAVVGSAWGLHDIQMRSLLAQVSYSTIAKELMWQLAQERKSRHNVRCIMDALKEIENLKVRSPMIDGNIKKMYICKFKNNPIYTPDDQWGDMVFDHEISSSDFSSGDSDNSRHHSKPVRSIRTLNDNPILLLDDLVDARELSLQSSSHVTFHIPPHQPEHPIHHQPPPRLEES